MSVTTVTTAPRAAAWWTRAAALMGPQVSSAARERRDTLALLAAVALVVLPHFGHLSAGSIAIFTSLWCLRLALALTQRAPPGRWLLVAALALVTLWVFYEHRTLVGRDAGVDFLLLLMALKTVELRARRDVLVVIFLSFFVLLTQFMFGQGLHVAAFALAGVVVLFWVLIGTHVVEADMGAGAKLALTGKLFVQALPVAVVLFVLFPRLSGPLWSMGVQPGAGRSGLSEEMAPGSVGNLLLSDEIAFRVQFDGAVPPQAALYWRGPVLGGFNGRVWFPRWRRAAADLPPTLDVDNSSALDYTVTLEPQAQPWLFAVEMPTARADTISVAARMTPEGQLIASGRPSAQRLRYTVRSYTRFTLGADEGQSAEREYTALPSGFNPRTLEFARQLEADAAASAADSTDGSSAQSRLVDAVLGHFRRNEFHYTLEPPLLGRDSVDEFLFDTRRGFCEHYASAFVVLMRAVRIPARVVTGYQGGELNPVDGFLTVRQADAHAWAEVWLAGRGWVRVDPTAAVDPARVDLGARAATRLTNPDAVALALAAGGWLRSVRQNWEAVHNGWNQWVLSYSPQRQRELLQRLGFEPSLYGAVLALAIAMGAILLLAGVWSLRQQRKLDPLALLVEQLHDRLIRAGIAVAPHEGLRQLRGRLARELQPDSYRAILPILAALEAARYSRAAPLLGHADLRRLRAAVRNFRAHAT